MACVFALGVWHRPTEPRLAACPPVLPAYPATFETPVHAIARYLSVHYDDIEVRDSGAVVETGLAYSVDAPIDEVHDELLRRLLPGTHFFRTWLRTGEQHDSTAGAIVSFRRTRGGDDIRSFSVTEEGRLRKFLGQFIGVVAPDLRARRELALAIGRLLNEGAGEGTANLAADRDLARVQIWRADRHWRDIDVTTDHDGRVAELVVLYPGAFVLDVYVH